MVQITSQLMVSHAGTYLKQKGEPFSMRLMWRLGKEMHWSGRVMPLESQQTQYFKVV